ncbi:unnamed protein product [Linum tenue]|uniref:Uncharacterized protein n=1 Tax=Linum tenue TaxID=586396 RepID=A0AAV0L3T5_9ROSI|nr:unnamed protein product [Linum tenue]
MAPFDFKSNKHFVASSDGVTLQVYELTKSTLTHPSSIRKTHWREVASINTNLDGDDGGGDNTADETRTYDGLVFFDGHGKIQGWEALTKLAQHLKRLTLMVNPGGHCFQDVNELGEYVDFGVHYLRLNDLFSWPHHGVDLTRTDMWGSSELKYHDPRHGQRSKHMEGGSGISMEKYKELKRLLTEKDEKLVNLKEEMDDELQNLREKKEDELQELKEEIGKLNEAKEEELKKLRKEKDEELRKLSKKKDVELQMLRKGKDGGAALQKIRKEKDDELRKLKNEMEEEMEKLRKEKEDELEKLEKDKEEETLTRLMEKDDELQKLKKEKEEELRKMVKRKDEELQKLKNGKTGGANLQALRKEKEEEIQKLKREKDEEIENLKRQKDEDIEKAVKRKEAETLCEKNEELRKLRKEKEDELRKLMKEKDEEIRGKPSKYTDEEVEDMKKELAKLRDQLSSTSTVKSSSVLSPGGKVLYGVPNNEEWAFHVSHRRPVPQETFICFTSQVLRHHVKIFHLPTLTEPRLSNLYSLYHSVDEGIAEEWLAPPEKGVHTNTFGQGQFDVNNWWFAKTSHPEGGTTMMAYYYGDRYCIHNRRWGTIRIPYPNGVDLAANRNFYLANLCGKIVFCFTYRN